MKQYLDLLSSIKRDGTQKPPARSGMPSTQSLFGYQFRHSLNDGFPLLTTKEINFKHIVTELLWFLRGDTNIKYLVDNGCNIWNEDAYNYYKKKCDELGKIRPMDFVDFIFKIKNEINDAQDVMHTSLKKYGYVYGDCGWQYGRLWRNWDGLDQISELIKGLKENPESRRHILTALNPAHYNDLALFPCHCLVQFNCRPLSNLERSKWAVWNGKFHRNELMYDSEETGFTLEEQLNQSNIPKYYLDCQLYQRSCDVFLGVPYNIASYSLLTHILSEIVGMIPGDFIHTFGDVHIYSNHIEQVDEQLNRIPSELPKLKIIDTKRCIELFNINQIGLDEMIKNLEINLFSLLNYNPQPKIKAKLSTGLK